LVLHRGKAAPFDTSYRKYEIKAFRFRKHDILVLGISLASEKIDLLSLAQANYTFARIKVIANTQVCIF
jgi:hypothetical protein